MRCATIDEEGTEVLFALQNNKLFEVKADRLDGGITSIHLSQGESYGRTVNSLGRPLTK